jgi:hypothetical protein
LIKMLETFRLLAGMPVGLWRNPDIDPLENV